MMIGLIVNLGLLPVLKTGTAHADPSSAGTTSGTGVNIGITPVDVNPGDINNNVINEAHILSVQQQLFARLFQTPWQENHWTYPINGAPQTGGAYEGENYLGQPYVLEAAMAIELDLLGFPGLTEEQLGDIVDQNVRIWAVVATISTALDSVPVHGTAVSFIDESGHNTIHFLPSDFVNPASPLFWPDQPETEVVTSTMSIEIAQANLAEAGNGDCDHCTDKFNRDVERAERDYRNAVNLANLTLAIATAACHATYNIAKNAADGNLQDCMLLAIAVQFACRIAGLACGWLVLACQLACSAIFAASTAVCIRAHQRALNAAAATRTICLNAANAAHAAAIAAAEQARQDKLDDAADDLADCLQNCGGGEPNIGSTEIIVDIVEIVTR